MTLNVVDVPERRRYEIVQDGAVLGHAAYQKADELIVFTHTEVDPGSRGGASVDDWYAGRSTTSAPRGLRSCRSAPSSSTGWPLIPSTPTWTTGARKPR